MNLVLDETAVLVEAILVSRGHAPLTIAERQQLQASGPESGQATVDV
jgi:hypothetical protein